MEPAAVRSSTSVSISLVLATLGRVDTIEMLLRSLAEQTLHSFEILIVDQNSDDRLVPLVEHWKHHLAISHLRADPGLSRSRNLGLNAASGAIVGFPDDDCWYPSTLLADVSNWFSAQTEAALLCCIGRDSAERESITRWPPRSAPLDRSNVLRTCSSACLFVRREDVLGAGGFDEGMGLGARTPFQSAEDLDLALRILQRGRIGVFERSLHVYHPLCSPEELSLERAVGYGRGFGRLLRKHRYGPFTCTYHVLRAAGGILVAVLQGRRHRALFHWSSLRGRVSGYLARGYPSAARMSETCMAETRSGEKS